MPDSLEKFLSSVPNDEAARIWEWLVWEQAVAPQRMVDVIAATHQHVFEREKE